MSAQVTQPQSVVEGVMKSIQDAQTSARESMRELEEEIRSKTEHHSSLVTKSVSVPQAAALIARDIKQFLARERSLLIGHAVAATHLRCHASFRRPAAMLGDGSMEFETSVPTPTGIISFLNEPAAVLALVLDDAAIERLALSLAREAGAPEDGPSVQDLCTEANSVASELEALFFQKLTLDRGLAGLLDSKLSSLFDLQTATPSADGSEQSVQD